ncbi:MAG: hypothetical protein KJ936_05675 [Proteobacteria bacterium]|nr:hypothetical protein [Pseudomonadota bacterium]MBU2227145.1 hypothetical protein [Pseudomonadota bacterium]MBU2260368.1 hypothetical protein [Pseudomonadota bacterium]
MEYFDPTALINDGFVKSKISPPPAGGDEGEGEITYGNTVTYHPHPNPPPSRGRRFRTFYEIIKTIFYEFIINGSQPRCNGK